MSSIPETRGNAWQEQNSPKHARRIAKLIPQILKGVEEFEDLLKELETKPYRNAFLKKYGEQIKEAHKTITEQVGEMRTYSSWNLETMNTEIINLVEDMERKLNTLNAKLEEKRIQNKINLSKATPYTNANMLRNYREMLNALGSLPRPRSSTVSTAASDPRTNV